jgi:translation initiation factor IF-3
MAYTEHGAKVLERVKLELADVAVVEVPPKMEGRHMNMILSPTPEVLRRIKDRGTTKKQPVKADSKETEPANSE